MRRRVVAIQRSLPPIKLYLDDIDYLFQAVKEINQQTEIVTSEHILSDPSEISQIHKRAFHHLKVHSSHPYFEISLQRSYASIECSEQLQCRGVMDKVSRYLRKRRAKLHYLVVSICALAFLIVLLGSILRLFAVRFPPILCYLY
jgi:hypothetical protein